MSPGKTHLSKYTLIRNLEKFKAGLGSAGLTAVAVEAIGPKVFGSIFAGPIGNVLPFAAAAVAAFAAAKYTEVSPREIDLDAESLRERNANDAAQR